GLTGTTPRQVAVPAGAFDAFAGERAERVVVLQVDEHVKRSAVRHRVREALPEVPARALKTVDVREQVEQDTGSWRLAATMLAIGGLVAGGVAMALAYAVAGALGGAGL